jgi:MFS family permease
MSRAYRGWVLLLFTLIATFGFVDRIVVQILVQPIKAELHATDAQMGLLGGLMFAVLYVLLSIPIARLAERKNRVAITSIGTALWSIATAACGFASSFGNLLIARIGVGIGEAAGQPATYSMIADYLAGAQGRCDGDLRPFGPVGRISGRHRRRVHRAALGLARGVSLGGTTWFGVGVLAVDDGS